MIKSQALNHWNSYACKLPSAEHVRSKRTNNTHVIMGSFAFRFAFSFQFLANQVVDSNGRRGPSFHSSYVQPPPRTAQGLQAIEQSTYWIIPNSLVRGQVIFSLKNNFIRALCKQQIISPKFKWRINLPIEFFLRIYRLHFSDKIYIGGEAIGSFCVCATKSSSFSKSSRRKMFPLLKVSQRGNNTNKNYVNNRKFAV